jgi:hypothetical protein
MAETELVEPATPECERMKAVAEESNAIGAFLDWLGDQKIYLVHTMYDAERGKEIELSGPGCSYEQLLARYYSIDLEKVSRERDAILRYVRARNEQATGS